MNHSAFVSMKRGWDIFQPFRKHFAIVLAFVAVIEGVALIGPFIFGKVLNALQSAKPIEFVLGLIAIAVVISVLGIVVSYFKEVYELRHIDFAIDQYLTEKTLDKILGLSIGQHRSQNSGLTQSVVSNGQSSLQQITWLFLYNIVPLFVRLTIILLLLIWFSKIAGSIVLFGVGIFIWMAHRDNKKVLPLNKVLQDKAHNTRKHFSEILQNTSLIQASAQEKRIKHEQGKRIGDWAENARNVWIPYNTYGIKKHGVTTLIRSLVLVLGSIFVIRKQYQFGDFVILMSWTTQATAELWMIGRIQRQWIDLWSQVKKYFELLDIVPDIQVVENPIRPEKFNGQIEFRNVSFTYKNQSYISIDDKDSKTEKSNESLSALDNVSFVIKAGERVAFVGESGAGKSTLVHLLIRAFNPDEGQILIDTHDLRLLDLKSFRESIGIVEQEVALFDSTMRYNILFGLNGRGDSITDEKLDQIAEMSRISRFKHRLTEGWETKIGQRGVKLSGGEKQRVGIARALIKDPRILILDEATSSLDPKNERFIKEAVKGASVGRTAIIIAHRLSTVRDVDRIYVMDKGSIVDYGRHEELCETSEIYRELVQDQLVQA